MKREKIIIETRRQNLLKEIKRNPKITIEELSKKYNASKITINRDLNFLQNNNLIKRFYGGFSIIDTELSKPKQNVADKIEALARYAANLIEDNQVIFINGSSTALSIVKHIKDKRVTVITNNTNIINISHSHLVSIVLTGGELREVKGVTVGDFALNNLSRVTVTKAFFGCNGVSPSVGFTTEYYGEVSINELMLKNSKREKYIIADSTKLGVISNFVSGSIDQFSNIITNDDVSESIEREFLDVGIKLIKVPLNYSNNST